MFVPHTLPRMTRLTQGSRTVRQELPKKLQTQASTTRLRDFLVFRREMCGVLCPVYKSLFIVTRKSLTSVLSTKTTSQTRTTGGRGRYPVTISPDMVPTLGRRLLRSQSVLFSPTSELSLVTWVIYVLGAENRAGRSHRPRSHSRGGGGTEWVDQADVRVGRNVDPYQFTDSRRVLLSYAQSWRC